MEPITTFVGEKAIGLLASKFKDAVIQRWGAHRARQFMDALLIAIGEDELIGGHPDKVQTMLDKAMADDNLSAVLFDAYRRVTLSASRDIGPRIIAFLTARLLLSEEEASEQDDAIFRAAEFMNDKELRDLAEFVEEHQKKAVKESDTSSTTKKSDSVVTKGGALRYHYYSIDESLEVENRQSFTGPMNLSLDIGSWAGKAEWLGLVHQESASTTLKDEGSDYHIGEGMFRRIDWWMTTEPSGIELARLVRRCSPTTDPQTTP